MVDNRSFLTKYVEDHNFLETLEDYERTPDRKVYKLFCENITGSKPLIESFNDWYDNIFKSQVTNSSFTADDGTKIEFKDPRIDKPVVIIDGKEVICYPQYCRDRNIPYRGKISVVCEVTKKTGEKILTNVELGYMPIMLGSKLCNLEGKTPEELLELDECIMDPFGYFILKTERSVVSHDKARYNLPMVYNEKGKLILKYTGIATQLTTNKTSKILEMTIGKKWGTVKIKDWYDSQNQYSIEKHIPVFIVFKLLNDLDPEEAYNKYIKNFIPSNSQKKIKNFLNSSIVKVKNMEDYISYLCKKRKRKYNQSIRGELKEEFKQSMLNALFVNIQNPDENVNVKLKCLLLGFMISKFSMTAIGVIPMDSRDSWSTKRFDVAGTQIKILMGQILRSLVEQCKRDINKYSTKPDFSVFGGTIRSKAPNLLEADFRRSFNTPFWGTKNYNKQHENVSEATKRDTPLQLWAMCSKNNKNVDSRDKKMSVREIHPSQRGNHCLTETPESASISLVKYFAVTCRPSLETKETLILDHIKDLIGNKGKKAQGKNCEIVLMLNGKFTFYKNIDIVYCNEDAKDKLKEGKITGELSMDIEILLDPIFNILNVYTDSSRPTCPYFVVNKETNNLVIEEIDGWNMSYKQLITSGAIEFLSARECESEEIVICYSYKRFLELKKKKEDLKGFSLLEFNNIYTYSHCNIEPNQILGLTSSSCPFTNHQMTTRTTFNSAMIKQALGYGNTSYERKIYGGSQGFKRLLNANRPICESESSFLPKQDVLPSGQTAMVGFMTDPENQEDAIIVSEDFINSGNLTYVKYIMIRYQQPSFPIGTREIIEKPPLRANESPEKYVNIQDNGFPKLDSYIKEGDCIIGKVLKTKTSVQNKSIMCGVGEEGYVDRIIKTWEKDKGNLFITVKIRSTRKYQAGDKLAIRYAQKGTIGRVEKKENLPFVTEGLNKGMTPDIIFNPMGYPSRQTVGLLIEGLLSKAAIYTGKRVDSSAFTELKIDEAIEKLEELGLDKFGKEKIAFRDGRKVDNKITIVPLFEQVLKHQVLDKIQSRSTGNKNLYTHQPRGGRSVGGGLRVGEMEKDAFVAHGASGVLVERMMKVSDEFKVVVCQNCGIIINNKNCTLCDNSTPGVLTIPYVFKLLINLLNGAGIDVRMNTSKIDTD